MKIETLAQLVRALDATVEPQYKAEIAALAEENLYQLHLGLNGLVRSLAYYKNESLEGKEHFQMLGFPDEGRVPRRFVWNPTRTIDGRRARWACGQAAFEPVHMSTGRYLAC